MTVRTTVAAAAISILAQFGPTTGWLILQVGAVALGVLTCAVFSTIALTVVRLERTRGKQVFMGPTGFFFTDG